MWNPYRKYIYIYIYIYIEREREREIYYVESFVKFLECQSYKY